MLKLTYIVYLFILSILLSPLFFKFINLPLNILFIPLLLIFFTYFYSQKKEIYVPKIFLKFIFFVIVYDLSLTISILLGINISDIPTKLYFEPSIPEYYKSKQIILGFIYNNLIFIYIILFFFLLQKKHSNPFPLLDNIIKIIYIFALINSLFNFIEILIPPLHQTLMLVAGYENINYFFVPRPVSLVLNSYINSFFCAFFSFWSFYYFYRSKNIEYFILFIIGFFSTFIVGARYGLILLLLSIFIYLTILRKVKYIFIIVLIIILPLSIFLNIRSSYLELIFSLITLSDNSGSANIHKELMFTSIEIIINHFFGVGIGKTDFGALNVIPSKTYNPESYLLSLFIGGGVFSFFTYLLIHFLLLYKLYKNKNFHILSFNLSIILVSAINIQILQSVTVTAIIGLLYNYAFYKNRIKK